MTPYCMRSKYQRAADTLLRKAEYRIHKELDIASVLKKLNECHNICRSLLTSLEHPADLRKDYAPTYTNALDISLELNKSLSIEDEAIQRPLPVT